MVNDNDDALDKKIESLEKKVDRLLEEPGKDGIPSAERGDAELQETIKNNQ